MTIYTLYIFDRHCQCIYFQNWTHQTTTAPVSSKSANGSTSTNSGSMRLNNTTSSSRFSTSSANSSMINTPTSVHTTNTNINSKSMNADTSTLQSQQGTMTNNMTQQSGVAAGSVISLEEEAKLVYGVILSLRNFVRKLRGSQDGFISYRTSAYRLHYYETPTGLKFVINSDPATENLRHVLKQIYSQLYVEFVVKNGLMRFDDTRWEISQGFLQQQQQQQQQQQLGNAAVENASSNSSNKNNAPPPPGNISNELFRVAVDRFIRGLKSFE